MNKVCRDEDHYRLRKGETCTGCGMTVGTTQYPPDPVNHPPHYTQHPSGVECIDITEHFVHNVGSAIKYLWRAGLKTEDPIEDLRKAAWYVNREIERLTKGKTNG